MESQQSGLKTWSQYLGSVVTCHKEKEKALTDIAFHFHNLQVIAHSLILQLWAIRSERSRHMSNHEQIPQVAHDKWATVSDLKNERIAHSLFFGERCEGIAQVTHKKWANMSDSLRMLTKNERPWVNHSGHWPIVSEWAHCSFFWVNRSFAHFLQIMSNLLWKPMSKFPALL